MRGKFLLLLFVVLLVLNLGGMAVNETYTAPSDRAAAVTVVIPDGGSEAAADALARAGVVAYPVIFRAAAWFTRGQGPLHAGEFVFPARASLAQVLAILRHGAVVQHQVTIPEGLTAVQIAKIINDAPDMTGVASVPAEGAVWPQTYDYVFGTRRAELVARAEAAGRAALKAAYEGRDAAVDLSAEQALNLASIVQEETPVRAELSQVAAVYENRLSQGMKLQADPTVIYAASHGAVASGAVITRADLADDSAYNTYLADGLPPGPICSPGLAALDAVLHPARSENLYFVATGNGGHVFSRTYKQHLANVAAYRTNGH